MIAIIRRLIKSPAFRGISLSLANATRLVTQFAAIPILAHLLSPADFGLVGFVLPIILLLSTIGDFGLSSALVREKYFSEDTESTLLLFTSVVGLIFAFGMCSLAFPISWILHAPKTAIAIIELSPVLLLSCVLVVPIARLQRERRTWAFALADIISTTSAAVVAIWLAFEGFGFFSLVAQQLIFWILRFFVLTITARTPLRLVFKLNLIRPILIFSLPLTSANITDFISRSIDNLLIGRFLGTYNLGLYSLGYQLMRIPDAIIGAPIAFVVFPTLDRQAKTGKSHGEVFSFLVVLITTISAPVLCGLALIASPLVQLVLGGKWHPVASVIAILAPAGIAQCLVPVCYAVLMGTGRTGLQLRQSMLLGTSVLLGVIGALPFGLNGATVGVAIGTLFGSGAILVNTCRVIKVGVASLAKRIAPAITAAMAMVLVCMTLSPLLSRLGAAIQVLATISLGALIYGALMALRTVELLQVYRQLRTATG